MSFRPPFSAPSSTFPHHYNNNNFIPPSNNNFACKPTDGFQLNVQRNFANFQTNPSNVNTNHSVTSNMCLPTMYDTNKSSQELISRNQFCNNAFDLKQQCINNVPFSFPNSTNLRPGTMQSSSLQRPIVTTTYNQGYTNVPVEQNPNRNPPVNFQMNSNNSQFNSDQRNVSSQRFSYPEQNVVSYNSPTIANFQGYQNNNVCYNTPPGNNIPRIFNSLPPNYLVANNNSCNLVSTANNSVFNVPPPQFVNSQTSVPMNNSTSLIVPSANLSQVPSSQNNSFLNIPPPTFKIESSYTPFSSNANPLSEKELKLSKFLAKFSVTDEKTKNKITVPEFHSALSNAFSLMKLLAKKKSNLQNLINASESEWSSEMQSVNSLQKQLSEICSFISSPVHLASILNKLKCIKKKREQKKKTKLNKLSEKIKAEQNRKDLHQEIDKWLDDIKEKNLKLKREVEMKKEADFILLEVRRKIQEANRTIEKIKVFEKLRNARRANAIQKGLRIMPEHNENFEKKVSILKETMLRQLADYEAEEKALKVMLETEQEGQLEEKTQWELKRIKTLQQKRQKHIKDCLFGTSDDPLPSDPLYLFNKYHTSANNSSENLIQIRHHWDLHLTEDGESVPQQWVVPVAPSNSLWEHCLVT